jgi:hypothetical protein
LNRQDNPIEAVQSGSDYLVCGDCPLRGSLGRRSCYVNVARAPLQIWRAYHRGVYRQLQPNELTTVFAGRFVRFGSYGEPVLIGLKTVQKIAEVASGFTGYTHQWRNPIWSAYKRYFMASCGSEAEHLEATVLGWRTFTISTVKLPSLMVCPASEEFESDRGFKLDCLTCGRCSGNSIKGRSVQIAPHGSGKNRFENEHQLEV